MTNTIKQIKIATRKSPLALYQTKLVAKLIKQQSDIDIELVEIQTSGDKFLDTRLDKIGGKGLFIKELEIAMLEGNADIAVHSMKDLPYQLPESFCIASVLKRGNPYDAFVSNKYSSFQNLPQGAVVGTSSNRRASQLLYHNPQITIEPLRGNLQTRLRKLDEEKFDAIVLAVSGLQRLEYDSRIQQIFDTKMMIPASTQGVIGIECLSDNQDIIKLLNKINHSQTKITVDLERSFIKKLQAGCHFPVGIFSETQKNEINATAFVGSLDGKKMIYQTIQGEIKDAQILGVELAEKLLKEGGQNIINQLNF